MTIYLDIVILENLFMNFIILFATGIINKTKINYIKIFLSSLIGVIYAIVAYMSILKFYSNIIVKIILSICMVYVAFRSEKLKVLLKQVVIFYLTSFTFGGISFALLYFIKPQDIAIISGVYIGTYPIKIALISGIVGFFIMIIAFNIVKGKISKSNMYCEISINLFGKVKLIKAVVDTGNFLKEPITGKPVIVVEREKLEGFIDENIISNTEKIINGQIEDEIDICKYLPRIKIIPFSSLGRKNGLILGVKVDSVKIDFEDVSRIMKNVIVGIYNDKLSNNDKYNALVGIELIENTEKIEAVI